MLQTLKQQFNTYMNRYFLLVSCLQLWREVTAVSFDTCDAAALGQIPLTGSSNYELGASDCCAYYYGYKGGDR